MVAPLSPPLVERTPPCSRSDGSIVRTNMGGRQRTPGDSAAGVTVGATHFFAARNDRESPVQRLARRGRRPDFGRVRFPIVLVRLRGRIAPIGALCPGQWPCSCASSAVGRGSIPGDRGAGWNPLSGATCRSGASKGRIGSNLGSNASARRPQTCSASKISCRPSSLVAPRAASTAASSSRCRSLPNSSGGPPSLPVTSLLHGVHLRGWGAWGRRATLASRSGICARLSTERGRERRRWASADRRLDRPPYT